MVFSTLSVFVAFGAVVGTSEGIQASQRRARREEHRSRKNNLVVLCPKSSAFSPQLEGRRVVLSGGRLFVDTSASIDPNAPFGHPFAGYFLPYPEARHAGLVSTITDEAPIMNWVFAERESYALCYGPRASSEGNFTGPWDCTRQDRRLTFGGWEGFMAVRIPPADESGVAFWALYFDKDGDGLKGKLADWPAGTVAVEVALARRELRTPKPPELTPEQLEDLKKRIEAERAKQEGKEVKPEVKPEVRTEVKNEEMKETKGESPEKKVEDAKGDEKDNKVERDQKEENNDGEIKVRHNGEGRKSDEQKMDEEKNKQSMLENDRMQKEKEQKERKEKKLEKKRERERKETEWQEREAERRETEEKGEAERARMQKEKEQQPAEQQNRQRRSRRQSRQRQRRSTMSATSSASARTTEVESSSNSVADDEADEADDDYTSSVYSMFTDSRRASSSGLSVPDAESSSD